MQTVKLAWKLHGIKTFFVSLYFDMLPYKTYTFSKTYTTVQKFEVG